jgi:hypothetical protein
MDIPIISINSSQAIPLNKNLIKKGFVIERAWKKIWRKFIKKLQKSESKSQASEYFL